MNGWPFPNPRMDVHPPISRQQLKNRASNGCNAVLSSYSYNQFCPCFPDICSYCNVMLYISCYVKGSHFESGGHWAQVRAMKKNWGGQIWRTWKYNYLHVWEKKHQHGSCNVLAPGFRVRSGLNCWLGTTAQGLAQALSKLVLLLRPGWLRPFEKASYHGFVFFCRIRTLHAFSRDAFYLPGSPQEKVQKERWAEEALYPGGKHGVQDGFGACLNLVFEDVFLVERETRAGQDLSWLLRQKRFAVCRKRLMGAEVLDWKGS